MVALQFRWFSFVEAHNRSPLLAMRFAKLDNPKRNLTQGLSVFKNLLPSFPRKREPRAALQHETLDSGFRRNDEILAIEENRKTLEPYHR